MMDERHSRLRLTHISTLHARSALEFTETPDHLCLWPLSRIVRGIALIDRRSVITCLILLLPLLSSVSRDAGPDGGGETGICLLSLLSAFAQIQLAHAFS